MQFTLPRSREDLYAHSINENRRGEKQKEQKFSTHVYTYGNSKTSFYECTQASPVWGLRIRLRLLTEEFACLELIKGSDYSIHNGQGQVSMAELSL